MKQVVAIKKVSVDDKKKVSVTVEFHATTKEAQAVVLELINLHAAELDINGLQTELDI